MNGELVSVIIPTYNRGYCIAESIKSVLNQTHKNLEIIIIDDCSTDDTKDVVATLKDERIRYYVLDKNSGACVARNRGVMLSRGNLIAFHDSDDLWHRDKLEKQIAFMDSGKFEFVTSGYIKHMGDSKIKEGYRTLPKDKTDLWCKLLNGNWMSTQTFLCYKYCFDKICFDTNVKRFQDWDLALQAVLNFRVGCMDDYLVDVFVQEDSITNTQKRQTAMEYILNKHFSDIIPCDLGMIAQYYKSVGDIDRFDNPRSGVKYYKISVAAKFSLRIVILIFLCYTGLIKLIDKRMR